MTTIETGRRRKAVLKSLLNGGKGEGAQPGVRLTATILVNNVDTVPTTMTSRSGLRLTIKTYAQASEITKLSHRILKITARATSHRTLSPSMYSTKVSGLEGVNSA